MKIRALLSSTVLGGASLLAPAYVHANPLDGSVVAGSATISQNGNKTDIYQSSGRAIIDWRGFDIAPDEHTEFHQPSSSAITLNRVRDTKASRIEGKITANGNVVIINPNGVMFSNTATVDVNSLTVTTSDIDNDRFMNDAAPRFTRPGNPDAAIINEGTITAADAGLVGLVAPQVVNRGTITARMGKVQLASGDNFTLDLAGDGITEITVTGDMRHQLVANEGTIRAHGGYVRLSAAAARDAVDSLISNSGIIEAQAIGSNKGRIVLYAEGSNAVIDNDPAKKSIRNGKSTITNSGTLDVSGVNAGETGGRIEVLADEVNIRSGSLIEASGYAGGGEILIGGDYQGSGYVPAAMNTLIESGALIRANALIEGDGGKAIIWSDGKTEFWGSLELKALGESGDGGFGETSGKQFLLVRGTVDASSRKGRAGEWLLDPYNVTIASGSGTDTTATIYANNIKATLEGGTNVTITTGGTGSPGADVGDIAFNGTLGTLNLVNDVTLTLSAYRNIVFGNLVNITATNYKMNLVLNADNGGNGSGYVRFGASTAPNAISIDTNGGNINIGGGVAAGGLPSGAATGNSTSTALYGVSLNYTTLNASGGNIFINGTGYADAGSAYGVLIDNSSSVKTSGAGTISITGQGGSAGAGLASGSTSVGINIQGAGNVIVENGDLTLRGTGGGKGTGTGNHGVQVTGTNSYMGSTGTGDIRIVDTTGGAVGGTGATNYGVHINVANGIRADGLGDIYIEANGGQSNGANQYGINIAGAIYASGGDITFIGTGGFSYAGGSGINITKNITNTGSGRILLTGTGRSNSASGNASSVSGVAIGTGTIISSVDGNIEITGTSAGHGTGGTNNGVYMSGSNTLIKTTGSGDIKILNAQGGNTTGSGASNYGIRLQVAGTLDFGLKAEGTGSIELSGTGGGFSGSTNIGVSIETRIEANGGNITITGNGGNSSAGNNYGVQIDGDYTKTNGNGIITVTGIAGGNTNSSGNEGLRIMSGAYVETQNGDIKLSGTGGGAGTGGSNYGIYILSTGTEVRTTGTGNIRILKAWGGNNTGTGITASNYGLRINATGGLKTTGTGDIFLTQIKGGGLAGTGNANEGLYLGGYITAAVNRNIEITTNGGSLADSDNNYGIDMTGGSIGATGSGTITINATGGGGGTGNTNSGINMAGGAIISTENGLLTVTSTGGNNASGTGINNYGIYMAGTGTSIKSTGTGNVLVNAIRGGGATSSNYGIRISTSNGLYTEGTGNITLNTDLVFMNTVNAITSGGNLTIATYTDGWGISLGNAVTDTLNLSNTHLGYFTWGAGKTFTLGSSTTGQINLATSYTFAKAAQFTTKSGYDIVIDAQVTSSATGNALVFASGDDFINNVGASAINLTGGGRWIIYSQAAADDTANGLSAAQTINGQTYATLAPAAITTPTYNATQNSWVYAAAAPSGTITITANAVSITYGGSYALTYDFACSDGCANSVMSGALAIDGAATTSSGGYYNVGTWAILQGTLATSNGYTITFNGANLTVSAKTLNVTGVTASNKVYDGGVNATIDSTSAALSGIMSGDAVTLGTGAASGSFATKNAGTAKAITITGYTIGGADSGNYVIAQPTGVTADITAKAITITGAVANNKTYDATTSATLDSSLTALSGVIGGDTVTLDSSAASGSFANKNVGTNKAVTASGYTIGGADSGNYTLTQPTGLTADITAKQITVTGVTASNKIYDAATAASLNTGSAALFGVLSGDTVTLGGTASGAFGDANVGVGKTITVSGFTIGGGDAGNYTVAQPTGLTANITARALAITAEDKSMTYGGATPGYTYTVSGLQGADALSGVTLADNATTSASGNKNAGSWTIGASSATFSTGSAANYTITYNGGTLTIAQKALTISGVSAANKVYDGSASAVITGTAALSGNEAGDSLTLDISGASATFASQNAANGKIVTFNGYSVSGADANNYSFSQPATTTADITPATLTVTAGGSKIYGDADGALGTITGLIGSDTTTGALARAAGQNVGSYAINIGTLSGGGNYTISFVGGNYVINKAILTVTADNASKTQGNVNPAFTANYSGFKYGDSVVSLVGNPAFTTIADASSAAGNYAITLGLGTLSSGNYNFTLVDGVLTIAAPLTSPATVPNTVEATIAKVIPAIPPMGVTLFTGNFSAPIAIYAPITITAPITVSGILLAPATMSIPPVSPANISTPESGLEPSANFYGPLYYYDEERYRQRDI